MMQSCSRNQAKLNQMIAVSPSPSRTTPRARWAVQHDLAQLRGGHEEGQRPVRKRQRDREIEDLLAQLEGQLARAPRRGVQAHALGGVALDEPLDRPVDRLEEDGLRARPAAPDAARPAGEEHQSKREAGKQEDDQPDVLCVEGHPRQVETARLDVEVDGRVLPVLDERERQVVEDQERISDAAPAQEAALHVGRLDLVPAAARVEEFWPTATDRGRVHPAAPSPAG